ncbi:uncharacterized [Tachysurus ichikawai]
MKQAQRDDLRHQSSDYREALCCAEARFSSMRSRAAFVTCQRVNNAKLITGHTADHRLSLKFKLRQKRKMKNE